MLEVSFEWLIILALFFMLIGVMVGARLSAWR